MKIAGNLFLFLAEETTWETKDLLENNIKMAVPIMEFEGVIWVQLLQNRPITRILSTP